MILLRIDENLKRNSILRDFGFTGTPDAIKMKQ